MIEVVQEEMLSLLNTLQEHDFLDVFGPWQNCSAQCLHAEGKYFEGDGSLDIKTDKSIDGSHSSENVGFHLILLVISHSMAIFLPVVEGVKIIYLAGIM